MNPMDTTPKFIAKCGDDDRRASRHDDIDSAEQAARERSKTAWHRTAYVHRIGGKRIRQFEDGNLVAWLTSDGKWETR